MKEGRDGVDAMAESPLGQHLIKVIGNVYFSLIILSVVVFTIIAVTYQPLNPWVDSSKAIVSRSFSQTLPNATFHPDTSLLITAEDVDPSGSPSPLTYSGRRRHCPQTLVDSASLAVANPANASAPLVCGVDVQSLNYSHPAVLAAIRKFNFKVFKSLIFLAYETLVVGLKPNKCAVAWLFRQWSDRRTRSSIRGIVWPS